MCAVKNLERSQQITVSTIAKLAGFSTATVSRALNNKRKNGKYVTHPETLKKIKEICKQLNYKPNLLARAFVTQKSKTIAAVGFSDEPYFFKRLALAQNEASNKGYSLNVTMLNRSKQVEHVIEQMFNLCKYDGIWVVGSYPQFQEMMVRYSSEYSVPIVFTGQPIGCRNRPNTKCVGADLQKGFSDLITYLRSLGHKKYLWLIPNLQTDFLAKWYNNFIDAELQKNHIPKENSCILETSLDAAKALEITQNYFDKLRNQSPQKRPTVAISIWATMAHLHGIQEAGFKVPDDISFITLDYSIQDFGDTLRPPVAAFYEPPVLSAEKSITAIVKMIEDMDDIGSIPFEYIPLEMEFKKNASCKPL